MKKKINDIDSHNESIPSISSFDSLTTSSFDDLSVDNSNSSISLVQDLLIPEVSDKDSLHLTAPLI